MKFILILFTFLINAPVALAMPKWSVFADIIRSDQVMVMQNPAFRALTVIAPTDSMRVRIAKINSHINHLIRPVLEPYPMDYWQVASETLERGAGDCEDYAILKLQVLNRIGFSLEALRITIVHRPGDKDLHAVLNVYLDGEWLVLDNLHDLVINQNNMRYHLVRYLEWVPVSALSARP